MRSLSLASESWIYAGGAHHTVFSTAFRGEHARALAALLGVEYVQIDAATTVPALRRELKWTEAAWH